MGENLRNRHGRGVRGMLMPPDTPIHRSRGDKFNQAVVAAYSPIAERYRARLAHIDVAVDLIPRMRLNPDDTYFSREIVADGPVPLARLMPTAVDKQGRTIRNRIVVFRRPIEQRSPTPEQRDELLNHIFVQLIATYLNLDEKDIDPDFEPW